MSDDIEWHDPLPRNVPRQTYTPAIYALGLTLFAWGFLTSWVLVAAGVCITLVGVWGWSRELVLQAAHPGGESEGGNELEH